MDLTKLIYKLKYKLNDLLCNHHYSKINDYWLIQLMVEKQPNLYIELYRKCHKCGNIQTRYYDTEIELINNILSSNKRINSVRDFILYILNELKGIRLFLDIPNYLYDNDIWYPYYEKIKLDPSNKIISIIELKSYNRDRKLSKLLDITF